MAYVYHLKEHRGTPRDPRTQGKSERWGQALNNRILLENYYPPGALEDALMALIVHYNNHRHHESPGNLTPADVCFSTAEAILKRRMEIKAKTIEKRLSLHRQTAA